MHTEAIKSAYRRYARFYDTLFGPVLHPGRKAIVKALKCRPGDRILDGVDLLPMLRGSGPSQRDTMFFYRGTRLYAVRHGPWKVHFTTQAGYGDQPHEQDPPLLFHLEHDPSEKYDVAADHPEIVSEIMELVGAHRATIEPVVNQLDIPLPG